jgi:hypothetical protein
MYKNPKFLSDGETIFVERDGLPPLIVDRSNALVWAEVSGNAAEYIPPAEPAAAEKLKARRAEMECSTAQMGLALIELDKLETVEAAFYAEPRAAMIWRKNPSVKRRGPILAALKTKMTNKAIDQLFEAATAIQI